jgi:hypothetical protein
MTIALTIWLAGMPLALAVLIWDKRDVLANEDDGLFNSWPGIATAALFIVLWPVFLGLWLRDLWKGR